MGMNEGVERVCIGEEIYRVMLSKYLCCGGLNLNGVHRVLQNAPRDNTHTKGVCFVALFGEIS